MRFYGEPMPGVNPDELVGKLIVVEGADGSGRSTQMDLLRDFLEHRGHAILNVGLRRSTLVSEELAEAKRGNVLGEITRSLFYATDFADQLENRIVPALKAGFIVLADRYIYTLMARDIVRGADPAWVRSLYGIALVPHLVIYLRVSPGQLVERNFRKNATLDYWESGMDLGLSRDIFDSFIRYQRLIQKQFSLMQHEYGFHIVNGNRSVRSVAGEIFSRVEATLEMRHEF
ncbi:MAG: thymidylate kinase [Desulfuromonadales bacterium]|nr:MAG: thymidylate kinase [Desulfuromonadales bacterium]